MARTGRTKKAKLSKDTPSASSSFAHSSAWSVPPEKAARQFRPYCIRNRALARYSIISVLEGDDLESSQNNPPIIVHRPGGGRVVYGNRAVTKHLTSSRKERELGTKEARRDKAGYRRRATAEVSITAGTEQQHRAGTLRAARTRRQCETGGGSCSTRRSSLPAKNRTHSRHLEKGRLHTR